MTVVRRALGTSGEMVVAALVAAIVAAVGLFAFAQVQWPAFNSSNVTRALTTVGQVATIAVLAFAVWLERVGKWPWLAKLLTWGGLSAFVTVTLGMPLAATKLYLLGVSVDQEFRTEYLTRLTDSAALHDMTYADLPPFYPAGWFWIGGRVAGIAGLPGWEAFKPYAIGSLAVAAVVAYVLWSKLIRADWAILVAGAITGVVVAYGSPEPYGAIIALFIPPVLLLAWGGLHRPDGGGWGAIVGTGLFLGVAATFYTLYLAVAAFTVVVLAVIATVLDRSARPLIRLAVAGAIAIVVALTVWLPFLLEFQPVSSGSAFHYLPDNGAQLPLPMLHFSLLGALCMAGTLWLVSRARTSRRAQSLGAGVVAIYLWSLLSMTVTALGSTLLSFRLEVILLVLLAAAGVFGVLEWSRILYQNVFGPPGFMYGVIAVGAAGAIAFAQNIPTVLAHEITVAYTDTDGSGVRADKRPAGAAAYYGEIDTTLREKFDRPARDIVVLTADTSFLSFYPYLGFQALTSHYANPLADFDARAATIKQWSKLGTADELVAALDASPWRPPDAILFRHATDGYSLRLAEDVYPNDPNVRRYTVTFPAVLFDDPRFDVTEIGPFVLVTRR